MDLRPILSAMSFCLIPFAFMRAISHASTAWSEIDVLAFSMLQYYFTYMEIASVCYLIIARRVVFAVLYI